MRWILAALSFALLVSLAVTTVAVRANSLGIRSRLHRIEFGLVTNQMQFAKCERALRSAIEPVELCRRWQLLSRFEQAQVSSQLQ